MPDPDGPTSATVSPAVTAEADLLQDVDPGRARAERQLDILKIDDDGCRAVADVQCRSPYICRLKGRCCGAKEVNMGACDG